jgi:hypothetical protein
MWVWRQPYDPTDGTPVGRHAEWGCRRRTTGFDRTPSKKWQITARLKADIRKNRRQTVQTNHSPPNSGGRTARGMYCQGGHVCRHAYVGRLLQKAHSLYLASFKPKTLQYCLLRPIRPARLPGFPSLTDGIALVVLSYLIHQLGSSPDSLNSAILILLNIISDKWESKARQLIRHACPSMTTFVRPEVITSSCLRCHVAPPRSGCRPGHSLESRYTLLMKHSL